jgi:hypothetical protein
MEPYEEDMEHEEKVETNRQNVFELVPSTRSKLKKRVPPTLYGMYNSTYEIINTRQDNIIKGGTLFLMDINNKSRVINQFGSFYTKDWISGVTPSKLHSLVAETVYNGNIQ